MNTTLIDQLKQLNPTEGEWSIDSIFTIRNHKWIVAETFDSRDSYLIQLAPQMRLEILAMAKEIEFLNERIAYLLEDRKNKSPFLPQPKMKTAEESETINKIIKKKLIWDEIKVKEQEYKRLQKQINELEKAQSDISIYVQKKLNEIQEIAENLDQLEYEALTPKP